jgi:hypothetical protein
MWFLGCRAATGDGAAARLPVDSDRPDRPAGGSRQYRDGVYDHRGSGPGVQPVGALEAGVQRRLAGDDTRFAGVAVNRRLGTVST